MPNPDACFVCGCERPIELQMTARNNQILTMLSCPKCETRTWYADGASVTVQEILRITANDPEFVVMPAASTARSARVG